MQITQPSALTYSGQGEKNDAFAADFLTKLTIGDAFRARVIFAMDNVLHLKTAAGAFIRARLEGYMPPLEGQEIELMLVEKEAGLLKLRLGEPLRQQATVEQAAVLLLTEGKESAINAPVLRQTALPANPAPPQPALGQTLQQLTQLLISLENEQPTSQLRVFPAAGLTTGAPPQAGPAVGNILSPLFELFMAAYSVAKTSPAQTEGLPPASAGPLAAPLKQATPPQPPADAQPLMAERVNPPPTPKSAEIRQNPAAAVPREAELQLPVVATALPAASRSEALDITGRLVERLYTATENEPGLKELKAFVESLFVKIGGPAKKNAVQLKQAARSLEISLDLLQEVVKRSSLPQREELLQLTNRLQQQAAVLREERLFCLQLPVYLAEQKQTAELYMYRRQGGRKPDTNLGVTVLLALNTEHLGRLEAFIRVRQQDIDLNLAISKAAAVPFIKERSGALSKLLGAAGYRLTPISVTHLTKQNDASAAEAALDEFCRSLTRQVDIKI